MKEYCLRIQLDSGIAQGGTGGDLDSDRQGLRLVGGIRCSPERVVHKDPSWGNEFEYYSRLGH